MPGSAPFSSITSQPQFSVTLVSLVSALQVPIPGSVHSSPPTPQTPLPLSALSVPDLDISSLPPFLYQLYCLLSVHFLNLISESCSNIYVSGLEGVPLPSTPSGMSVYI